MPSDADTPFQSPFESERDDDPSYSQPVYAEPAVGTMVRPAPASGARTDSKRPNQWHVVLIDDDEHSYEYVIIMMMKLFRMEPERAFKIAQAVDAAGRAVCVTTHREHAELKREQVLGFGADPLIASCAGPMTCVLEPAQFDGDDEHSGDGKDDFDDRR